MQSHALGGTVDYHHRAGFTPGAVGAAWRLAPHRTRPEEGQVAAIGLRQAGALVGGLQLWQGQAAHNFH